MAKLEAIPIHKQVKATKQLKDHAKKCICANSRFEAKWALQVAIVGNWMKKWSVNTDNMVIA